MGVKKGIAGQALKKLETNRGTDRRRKALLCSVKRKKREMKGLKQEKWSVRPFWGKSGKAKRKKKT